MADLLNFGPFKKQALEMAQYWLRLAEEAERQQQELHS
jgi:hypothetical protein